MADGVKYYYHDQRPETKMVDGVDVHDFCTYSTTYSQTYPFLMVAEQYEDSAVDRSAFVFVLGVVNVVVVVVAVVVVVVVVNVHDFCTYLTTYSQTYLFLMVAKQYEDSAVDRSVVLLMFKFFLLLLLFLLLLSTFMTSALI